MATSYVIIDANDQIKPSLAPVSLTVRQTAADRVQTFQARHCANLEASRAVFARHRA